MSGPVLRPAAAEDGPVLARIDAETWSPAVTPAPRFSPDRPFFASASPADVLVAELDGRVAGYARVTPYLPLPSAAHVQQLAALAVAPAAQRRGVGRALLAGARDLAVRRGARVLLLRVLSSNPGAIALYRSVGYRVEGVLRGVFRLDGEYVDDVLMALDLTVPDGQGADGAVSPTGASGPGTPR
ncbi:GNAT family N-acetyltransferase [Thermobifida cellulosilytica]|uniref:GNAT family N-acetyltransferase n=1 Tax=Thermobifida cellulosilytica TaxID=144786 RepID=UPI000B2101A5|nr:GNAT family N-acetyltransferase [Thermobifida cellulosilytica]